ncbi:MAG: hypothetical protein A3H97_02685 [Acidobacteria bacterium RIFCSPLOWO2_02_FULL_65_29]|nr:MAG: hypothetical protein A3H97_02685 [Acidobacteria bacterium RIFCSPLOWO2_02_FULL_65_29]
MLAIRYLALTVLVIWLGGMIVLGLLVAPSTFGVLQTSAPDPGSGRMLAGAVFGEILRRFHLLAYGCGVVLLTCLFMMKFIGPPPTAFVARAALVALMLALAVYSGVPVSREIAALQAQVSGPIGALPETDARRVRFDRLHSLSTTLMTINMGLGIVLLYWYVRES